MAAIYFPIASWSEKRFDAVAYGNIAVRREEYLCM